jgi:hypothetical protein
MHHQTHTNPHVHTTASTDTQQRPTSPAAWWRRVCPIPGTRLAVSGDLPGWGQALAEHLQHWVDNGVTHIVDVRCEWSDEAEVGRLQPAVTYHWVGTDDDGSGQPDEWFDAGVEAALEAMGDPTATTMIHCHMGVNRGPSMAFAVMLALGWEPVRAVEAIRSARPIAAVLYGMDALDWWHRRSATEPRVAAEQRAALSEWLEQHPVDVEWVINRIRRAEYS